MIRSRASCLRVVSVAVLGRTAFSRGGLAGGHTGLRPSEDQVAQ